MAARAAIPQSAAPPPRNETPARVSGSAGADSSYNGLGESNCSAEGMQVQAWRDRTPRHLVVAVDLHRQFRPGIPLSQSVQRSLGQSWNVGGAQ